MEAPAWGFYFNLFSIKQIMSWNAFAGDYDNDVYTSDTKSTLFKIYIIGFELITIILVQFLIYLAILFLQYSISQEPGWNNLLCFLCGLSSECFLAIEG